MREDSNLTLRTFFDTKYRPLRLAGASARTVESYEDALKAWESCMGHDILLVDIGQEKLSKFVEIYGQRVHRGKPVTPNTVRGRLRHIYAILRFAGPAGYRSPDAIGVIEAVPYVRPPREVKRDPQPAKLGDIRKLLGVCDQARFPVSADFPGDWWRALLLMCLNTGLRVNTLFALRGDMIRDGILYVPGEITKGRKDAQYPMLPATINALALLGLGKGILFPFPHNRSTFFAELRRLNKAAGVAREESVTIHGIRRYVLNRFAEVAPTLAQKVAGHSSSKTTMDHYISMERASKAVLSLDLSGEALNGEAES